MLIGNIWNCQLWSWYQYTMMDSVFSICEQSPTHVSNCSLPKCCFMQCSYSWVTCQFRCTSSELMFWIINRFDLDLI